MAEAQFQKNLMNEIGDIKKVVINMKQELDFIKDVFEDKFLSDDDKKAIDGALEAKRKGELKSMEEVFN